MTNKNGIPVLDNVTTIYGPATKKPRITEESRTVYSTEKKPFRNMPFAALLKDVRIER